MDGRESFEFSYSAPEQEEIRRIRANYLPREESPLIRLRQLDQAATRRANYSAIALGVLSCLVMGTGMSMCMVWAGALFFPGILVGILGIAGICLAYPSHRWMLARERKRIAPEVLRLCEEILQQ